MTNGGPDIFLAHDCLICIRCGISRKNFRPNIISHHFQEIEGQEVTDKSKFAKRSSFKKSKHKTIEPVTVVKETEKNEANLAPKKELVSIYSYRCMIRCGIQSIFS